MHSGTFADHSDFYADREGGVNSEVLVTSEGNERWAEKRRTHPGLPHSALLSSEWGQVSRHSSRRGVYE